MKKILILLPVLFLFSCTDLLDELDRNTINGDLLYSTEDGYETLINACYAHARVWYGKTEGFAFTELGTDIFTQAAECRAIPMNQYSADFQGSLPVLEVMWNTFYKALNTCNTAIDRVGDAPLSEELRNIREGEARFLRAFYLWHIVETWGDVILYTHEVDGVVLTAERSSVDDFYAQIFEDLDIAIELLEGTPLKDNGHVTQWGAKAFKARMLLTRKRYQEASALAREVIDEGGSIYDSFAETFDIANCDGVDNEEAIWWIDYSEDFALSQRFDGVQGIWLWEGGNHGHMLASMAYWEYDGMWITPDVNRPYVPNMATLAYLDMFDETIDERYDVTFRSVFYVNDTTRVGDSGLELGDTAIWCTKYDVPQEVKDSKPYAILDRSEVFDENGLPIGARNHFISLYKFEDPSRPTGWEIESKRDAFVLRLPEMYLIVAEAEMIDGNMGTAVQYMNVLREKRAYSGKEADMRISAADLDLDFILDERARELGAEQLRWFDLKRTGKLIERAKKYNPDAQEIQEFHLIRPIPQIELDAVTNKDEFKQNPGYN